MLKERNILLGGKLFSKSILLNRSRRRKDVAVPLGVFLSAKQASALQNLPGKSFDNRKDNTAYKTHHQQQRTRRRCNSSQWGCWDPVDLVKEAKTNALCSYPLKLGGQKF